MMIEPKSINVEQLDSVLLSDYKQLPDSPGIYFAINAKGNIQYIGRSSNIRQRWIGHHRKPELKKLGNIRIAYLLFDDEELLADIEEVLINYFEPPLNGEIPHDPDLKYRFKNRSLRFTDDDWEKLAQMAKQHGYMNGTTPSRNGFLQAIASGELVVEHQPKSEVEKRLLALERRHENLSSSFAERGFKIERLEFELDEIKRLGKFYF